MSRATSFRTQDCTPAHAKKRLADAEKYLEIAGLVEDDAQFPQSVNVAAALAVLGAIAAADAACCAALGQRSRSQNHGDAAQLPSSINPGGQKASADFRRVIAKKDLAHYSFLNVAGQDLKAVLRGTTSLVQFARQAVQAYAP